jgi:hypothetical protein
MSSEEEKDVPEGRISRHHLPEQVKSALKICLFYISEQVFPQIHRTGDEYHDFSAEDMARAK